MYSIDFEKLISDLLPWFMRTPSVKSWLKSLIYPVQMLYADFLIFRTEQLFNTKLSGQVAHIEYALNHTYYGDGTVRRILIVDSAFVPTVTLYNAQEEEESVYIFNTAEAETGLYLFNTDESIDQTDFTVLVPESLVFDEPKMQSTITNFKQAGSKFAIQTYTE